MKADISSDTIIGRDCSIDPRAIIRSNVIIGNNVTIEANAIVGYDNLTRVYDASYVRPKLVIGDGCLVRAGAIIYRGSELGKNVKIGHNALIREGMSIGSDTNIGSAVVSEGYSKIGARCVIYSQCHLTPFMEIGDYVFFGPGVVTMSDPAAAHYRPQIVRDEAAPKVARGARIGAGSRLLPGVTIGEEAFVAAGAMVACNVPARQLWAGSPARKVRDIQDDEKLEAVG